jgi:hypothetical protein
VLVLAKPFSMIRTGTFAARFWYDPLDVHATIREAWNSTDPENSLPQRRQVRRGCVLMILAVLHLRSEPRKGHESPRQSLPDLTQCGRPPRATVRCGAFATDEYVF